MAEPAIRTVLLAREGAARDRLVEALVEAGADVVQAVDPLQADPAEVEALGADAVVVALEPAVEDALDAFQALLTDAARTVLFEEAALVLERSGWDAARWVRHLAAKLDGARSVLPPGTEPADETAPQAAADDAMSADIGAPAAPSSGPVSTDGLDAIDVPDESADATSASTPAVEPLRLDTDELADPRSTGESAYAFDPVNAEFDGSVDAAPVTGIEPVLLDNEALSLVPTESDTGYAFDPVSAEFDGDDYAPLQVPVLDFEFEPVDTDDIGRVTPVVDAAPPADTEPFAAHEASSPVAADEQSDQERAHDTDDDTAARDTGELDGSTLQLLDTDALPPAGRDEAAQPAARGSLDLSDLEHRISGLSLADTDSYGHGPQRGVVLVEGGLGGPDAVRQLLGAIPEGFPRPILIRLQLDGGRYDRLVRQMERATSLPVQLAEAGMSVAPGEVYFLPPGMLPARAGGELRFADGSDLASLPDAVPADDSAVLFLSGADASLVDVAMGPAWQGALVGGQSDEGCYDSVAAHAVAERGGPSGRPQDIADWLLARWMPAARQSEPGPGGLSL